MMRDFSKKLRQNFLQISTLGIIAACFLVFFGAAQTAADPSHEESSSQVRYRWQMEEYPALKKEFQETIEENLRPSTIPEETTELYLWQMEEYEKLREEFRDEIAENIRPKAVPETADEIYLWQLQPFPQLRGEFQEAYTKNLQRKNKPFTP